jgi:hypothetical protein
MELIISTDKRKKKCDNKYFYDLHFFNFIVERKSLESFVNINAYSFSFMKFAHGACVAYLPLFYILLSSHSHSLHNSTFYYGSENSKVMFTLTGIPTPPF